LPCEVVRLWRRGADQRGEACESLGAGAVVDPGAVAALEYVSSTSRRSGRPCNSHMRSTTGAGESCAIRSCLATAARHRISALGALTRAFRASPWIPGNRITPPGTKAPASPSQNRWCREPVYLTTVSWRCRGS
jgi:hypothetical protein